MNFTVMMRLLMDIRQNSSRQWDFYFFDALGEMKHPAASYGVSLA